MTLLEKIKAGKQTITISLWMFGAEKEQTTCRTIEDAKELLGRTMNMGCDYRLKYSHFSDEGDDDCWEDPEVAEVERALGLKPISELV
jgi:hypothetical protein